MAKKDDLRMKNVIIRQMVEKYCQVNTGEIPTNA